MALSAGRMQPVVFVEKRTSVYQPMSTVNADALERSIEHGARETGRSWRGIGDEIDAITLALNTGTMIKTGQGARDRLATSDRIGRFDANGSGGDTHVYRIDITGFNERRIVTPSDASDPAWSPLLR